MFMFLSVDMDETDTEIVENSNNESFKEREGKSGTVESVFSPLLRMMQWMACYTTYWNQEPSDRTTTTKFHFVACLIIIIYNWFDFFRYLTVFLGKSEASSYSMVSISFALFNATHAFSITTLFFAGSTYIRQLINRFLAYHSDHEEEFSVVFLRRLVILTLILASTTISTTAVVSITLTVIDYFTHDSVFGNLATPLTRGSPAAIAIVTVTSLTKICSSFSMVGLALFYGLSVFILFRDYRRLSWDFRDSCTNKTCILADDFNTLYSRHRKLTEILETANHLLEHFVFGAYGTAMPNVCFLLYGIIMGNLQMQDVVGLVQILILVTTGIVLVTWSGIKLSSKAQEPMHHLFQADLQDMPGTILQRISIFTHQLATCPPSVNMYGMMDINKSSVLVIIGTLVTYVIVVLQLKPTPTSMAGFSGINITTPTITTVF